MNVYFSTDTRHGLRYDISPLVWRKVNRLVYRRLVLHFDNPVIQLDLYNYTKYYIFTHESSKTIIISTYINHCIARRQLFFTAEQCPSLYRELKEVVDLCKDRIAL